MERARLTWTDERLDDLVRRMDSGFARVDEDIRALRTELSARIDAQGAELGARIDALQHAMIQIGAGAIFTMLVGFAGVIATQLA